MKVVLANLGIEHVQRHAEQEFPDRLDPREVVGIISAHGEGFIICVFVPKRGYCESLVRSGI